MPDLPLVGGHAPGTSEKHESETCVNLFIEQGGAGPYLRNRPGYEQLTAPGWAADAATPFDAFPVDQPVDIDSITRSGTTVTVTTSDAGLGYEVGDTVTIANSAIGDYNSEWVITTMDDAQQVFTFEIVATPADDNPSAADVTYNTAANDYRYDKEIRWLHRFDNVGVFILAVIGNRVYRASAISGSTGWVDETYGGGTPAGRFNSMRGAVSGAAISTQLGSYLIHLCDGVSANWEGVTPLTLSGKGGAGWDSSANIKSNTVTVLDGRLIRDDKSNLGRFYYSDLYEDTIPPTENAFSFATAEGSPDDVLAVLADRRQLFLFGEHTTEVWYNVGDANLPFKRFQGGFAEIGIAAPLSACRFDNSVVWLAKDLRGGLTVVRAGDSFQPVMISTPQINKLLNDSADYTYNASAFTMRWEGHEFYVLTLPGKLGFEDSTQDFSDAVTATDNITPITLVYDSNSKTWFKWKTKNTRMSSEDQGRWMPTAYCYLYDTDQRAASSDSLSAIYRGFLNQHIVGGRDNTGEVYALTSTTFTDAHPDGDQVIECERTLLPLEGPDRARVNAGPIELVTDQDPGENGTVTLDYAKDGKSFTGSPLSRTVGGATTTGRLMWKRVGRARRWIFRFAQDTTATVPVRWLRAISARLGE